MIDLRLTSDYVPNHEPEDSVYLISGETAETDDDSEVKKAVCSSTGMSEPEGGLGQHAKSFDSQKAKLTELGHVEASSFEVINLSSS